MPHITIKGRKIFYESHGKGFPLLFGHSYLWSGEMWKPQVDELAKSYECITPEMWGHGSSDALPETPYSIEMLAEDYWAFAKALGLEHFGVIGLSVGGMWGTHLALNHPDAVSLLVLMDTYVGPEPEASFRKYIGMLDAIEKTCAIKSPILEAIVPLFFSPVTLQTMPDLVNGFRNSLASIPTEQIPSVVSIGRAIFSRVSIINRLNEISMPTLIIVGEDDCPRPPHEAREMADKIPNAILEVISQAGHISSLERPEQVTGILKSFLKKSLSMQASA